MNKEALISLDTARTLAHVALLAAWEGQTRAAECILDALQTAKPKELNITICRAMVFASQDKHAEAIAILKRVLQQAPDNAYGKALLGYILFSAGEKDWANPLEEVIADGSDPAAVVLAQQILSENMSDQNTTNNAVTPQSHYISYA